MFFQKFIEEQSFFQHNFDIPLSNHLLLNQPKNQVSRNFHLECQITKKKICYCKLGTENLMPKKVRKKHELMNIYLKNYYNGFTKKILEKVEFKKKIFQQKIKTFQQKEDILYYMDLPMSEEEEKIFKQQKKDQEDLKQCYYCKSNLSEKWYNFNQPQLGLRVICHKCNNKLTNPIVQSQRSQRSITPEIVRKLRTEPLKKQGELCHFEFCLKNTNQEDFLNCSTCTRIFHAKCCQPKLNKEIVQRFDWQCNDCKLCQTCNLVGDEKKLLICDTCDRSFHMNCLNPKILKIPEDNWYCKDCSVCNSCHEQKINTLQLVQNYIYRQNHLYQKLILCDQCIIHFKNKNYCPICNFTFAKKDEGNSICCDKCNLWVHPSCDGINRFELQSIDKYICKICRRKPQNEKELNIIQE